MQSLILRWAPASLQPTHRATNVGRDNKFSLIWFLFMILSTAFQCPAQGGFYAIPDTCGSNYYSCINGVSYVMVRIATSIYLEYTHTHSYVWRFVFQTCPGTSIFDPAVGVCVPKEVASCLTTPTPTPTGSPTPTGNPSTYITQKTNQNEICHLINYLNFHVWCLKNTAPTPTGTTTTLAPGTFICPSEFGFFPTDVPCDDEFWRCSNGFSYLMVRFYDLNRCLLPNMICSFIFL